MNRVYVAAPWERYPVVLDVHVALRAAGMQPTSTWAELATPGPERSLGPKGDAIADAANMRAIDESDAMIVLGGWPYEGKEMYIEFARALWARQLRLAPSCVDTIYWVGSLDRAPLSVRAALDPGQRLTPVIVCSDWRTAVEHLRLTS